jgi:aspartate beta-hydroxylase
LEPGTVIAPHCGRTNASLRVHLPLWTDPGASMLVGDRQVTWRQGEMVVFDDSFQHAVRHDGDRVRIVLLFDVWHPELGDDERERILTRRSSTERQIVDYLRENDIEAVELSVGGTILEAGPHLAALIDRHLDDPSITRIELHGDELHYTGRAGAD